FPATQSKSPGSNPEKPPGFGPYGGASSACRLLLWGRPLPPDVTEIQPEGTLDHVGSNRKRIPSLNIHDWGTNSLPAVRVECQETQTGGNFLLCRLRCPGMGPPRIRGRRRRSQGRFDSRGGELSSCVPHDVYRYVVVYITVNINNRSRIDSLTGVWTA